MYVGIGEDVARLAQAAQVADHDQDDCHGGDLDAESFRPGTAEMTCSTADVVDTATVMM